MVAALISASSKQEAMDSLASVQITSIPSNMVTPPSACPCALAPSSYVPTMKCKPLPPPPTASPALGHTMNFKAPGDRGFLMNQDLGLINVGHLGCAKTISNYPNLSNIR